MWRGPRRRRSFLSRVYSFAITWIILSALIPQFELWAFLLSIGACASVAFLIGKASGRSESAALKHQSDAESSAKNPAGTKKASERVANSGSAAAKKPAEKKSYGPTIDPIVEEGNRALSEMGRLYMSIKDDNIRSKINEIMRITDKITQDAINDPSDIPQIKKFFNYYLPTTIKLLNAYDRMGAQGIEGENIDKSMNNIEEMLDVAIAAYKKRLDSLFEDQALDIETDIDVLNQMLKREGLTADKDFEVRPQSSPGFNSYSSGAAAVAEALDQR